jgi:hypothetical protein
MKRVDDVVACLGPASPLGEADPVSASCPASDVDPGMVRLACLSLASRLLDGDPARARVVRNVHRWFDKMAEDGASQHQICERGNAFASAIYAQAIDSELRRRGFASEPVAWPTAGFLAVM